MRKTLKVEPQLEHAITNFAIEIGFKAKKDAYNKAWRRLWKTMDDLGIFEK